MIEKAKILACGCWDKINRRYFNLCEDGICPFRSTEQVNGSTPYFIVARKEDETEEENKE